MEKTFLLGIGVTNTAKDEALEFIVKGLGKKGQKIAIFTPNPEIIVFAHKNESFRQILNSADLALPDGIGVMWAAKLLGKELRERITGVDFMKMLCKEASVHAFRIGFIGGGPKIAERTAECLRQLYPKINILVLEEDFFEKNTLQDKLRGKEKEIDILFVALGFPKQEKWIYEHLPKIPVTVAMAVGGSFDYISGVVPRAPKLVQNLGFEWLFRLIVQPWRIRRQLALFEFASLLLKEKFTPHPNAPFVRTRVHGKARSEIPKMPRP